jgi:fibronectin-binding protein 1
MDFRVLLPGETDTTVYTTDANGSLTFSLKHGDQVTIKDLPQGTRYTITEGTEDDAKSYKTTFVVTGGTSNAQEDKTQSGALNDGNAEVKVTNDRNLVVPTGIQTETQPAALILLLSAGALLLLGVAGGRKRRRG